MIDISSKAFPNTGRTTSKSSVFVICMISLIFWIKSKIKLMINEVMFNLSESEQNNYYA